MPHLLINPLKRPLALMPPCQKPPRICPLRSNAPPVSETACCVSDVTKNGRNTIELQSDGSWMAVESLLNRSCNHRFTVSKRYLSRGYNYNVTAIRRPRDFIATPIRRTEVTRRWNRNRVAAVSTALGNQQIIPYTPIPTSPTHKVV